MRSIIALLAIVAGATLLWANTQTTNPAEALQRAEAILNSEGLLDSAELKEAQSLLAITIREPALKDWALVLTGEVNEKLGQLVAAQENYSAVTENSAPSLDARLGLARLQVKESPAPAASLKELQEITEQAEYARRPDVRAEALLLQARAQYKLGELKRATEIFQQIRRDFPTRPASKEARDFVEKIRPQISPGDSEESRNILLAEARLLLIEGEYVRALSQLEELRKISPASDRLHYDSLAVQEQILRKLKRHEEGDALLLELASSDLAGIGDRAILQNAKNAWNINDHHRALEFLQRLKARFPKSIFLDEGRYIEGRILEEISQLAEAKDAYLSLIGSESTSEFVFLATKRLAWLYYVNDDFEHAARYFLELRNNAGKTRATLKDTLAKSLSHWTLIGDEIGALRRITELTEDYYHASYWLALALEKLDPTIQRRIQTERTPTEILEKLNTEQPYGYYGLLAREKLGAPQPRIDRSVTELKTCEIPLTQSDFKKFAIFIDHDELADFALREVDWFYASEAASSAAGKPAPFPFPQYVSRGSLYLRTHNYARSLETAEHALRRIDALSGQSNFSPQTLADCRARLLPQSYPLFEPELYEKAAKKRGVPVPLLYGISRTESYFNPRAESIVGARGLMQLMPDTAKREGWNEKDSLNDVNVNLDLGAKHLARLVADYRGALPHAIAAYNAGTAAVNRWRVRFADLPLPVWTELISYPETNKYVKRVLAAQAIYSTEKKSPSSAH